MDETVVAIGARVRLVRRRRGLAQKVVADRVGISVPYLSQLETGQRNFSSRGLIERLAEALGCSPADLTGDRLHVHDRRVLDAAAAVPSLTVALHDCTLDDPVEVAHRPIGHLRLLAARAMRDADQATYPSGSQLGDLILELHAALRGPDRREALIALTYACTAATYLLGSLERPELAVTAATRGWAAATRAEQPSLAGMLVMTRSLTLARIGAHRRATALVDHALVDARPGAGASAAERSRSMQAAGMLHLTRANLAARGGDVEAAATHLAEAQVLAERTGESNFMARHFGPSNVAAWRLSTAVEAERGPEVAVTVTDGVVAALGSRDRRTGVHLDLGRAWSQDPSPAHDIAVVRHIDTADRLSPVRVRQDPVVRDIVRAVDRRARRSWWELDSMKRRLGMG